MIMKSSETLLVESHTVGARMFPPPASGYSVLHDSTPPSSWLRTPFPLTHPRVRIEYLLLWPQNPRHTSFVSLTGVGFVSGQAGGFSEVEECVLIIFASTAQTLAQGKQAINNQWIACHPSLLIFVSLLASGQIACSVEEIMLRYVLRNCSCVLVKWVERKWSQEVRAEFLTLYSLRMWCPELYPFEVSLKQMRWLSSGCVPHRAGHIGGRWHQTATAKYSQHPRNF